MSHTHNDKKLLTRVRRIKGQFEAVERMLEEERDCYDVLQALTSCRGAINGLVAEMLVAHVQCHVIDGETKRQSEVKKAGEEVIAIVKSFLK